MRAGLAILALWAWASAALAQAPSAADVRSLNAAVFVQSAALSAPSYTFPQSSSIPTLRSAGDRPGAAASVTLWSPQGVRQRLISMGFKDGDKVYAGQGRVYLFAAVRGQAVGLNLERGPGGLQRDGWSTDSSSTLIGDGQVGVGWRKGSIEADMGYVHRSVHLKGAPMGVSDGYADDMAAVSFTFRPRW